MQWHNLDCHGTEFHAPSPAHTQKTQLPPAALTTAAGGN